MCTHFVPLRVRWSHSDRARATCAQTQVHSRAQGLSDPCCGVCPLYAAARRSLSSRPCARVAVVGTVPAAVRHRSPGRSLGRACTVYHVPTRPMLSARPPGAAAWRGLSSRPAPGLLWWVRFRRRSGTVLRIGSRRPFPGPLQNCAALLRRRVDALRARRTAGPCAICEPDSRPAFTRGVLRTPGSVSSHRLSIDGVGLPRAHA